MSIKRGMLQLRGCCLRQLRHRYAPASITFLVFSFIYTHIFPSSYQSLEYTEGQLQDDLTMMISKKYEHIWFVKHRPEIWTQLFRALCIISEGEFKNKVSGAEQM